MLQMEQQAILIKTPWGHHESFLSSTRRTSIIVTFSGDVLYKTLSDLFSIRMGNFMNYGVLTCTVEENNDFQNVMISFTISCTHYLRGKLYLFQYHKYNETVNVLFRMYNFYL